MFSFFTALHARLHYRSSFTAALLATFPAFEKVE
jgi:hypothetical protein